MLALGVLLFGLERDLLRFLLALIGRLALAVDGGDFCLLGLDERLGFHLLGLCVREIDTRFPLEHHGILHQRLDALGRTVGKHVHESELCADVRRGRHRWCGHGRGCRRSRCGSRGGRSDSGGWSSLGRGRIPLRGFILGLRGRGLLGISGRRLGQEKRNEREGDRTTERHGSSSLRGWRRQPGLGRAKLPLKTALRNTRRRLLHPAGELRCRAPPARRLDLCGIAQREDPGDPVALGETDQPGHLRAPA